MEVSKLPEDDNKVINFNQKEIDESILNTMRNVLYPGAKLESVLMVREYCKAARLDPLKKPVHIVPMKSFNQDTQKWESKDTIMPGIALYRIDASRSGDCAGISEPEFGPLIVGSFGGKEFCYPEWCKVTVKKIIKGMIVEFHAKEYWIENYASSSKTDLFPNKMWAKRPFGQIAKCAEAQAWRKGWPEVTGNTVTAEEMEGKDYIDSTATETKEPKNDKLKKLDRSTAMQYDSSSDSMIPMLTEKDLNDAYNLLQQAALKDGVEGLKIAWGNLDQKIVMDMKHDKEKIEHLKRLGEQCDKMKETPNQHKDWLEANERDEDEQNSKDT